jgi:hypothetical protein
LIKIADFFIVISMSTNVDNHTLYWRRKTSNWLLIELLLLDKLLSSVFTVLQRRPVFKSVKG